MFLSLEKKAREKLKEPTFTDISLRINPEASRQTWGYSSLSGTFQPTKFYKEMIKKKRRAEALEALEEKDELDKYTLLSPLSKEILKRSITAITKTSRDFPKLEYNVKPLEKPKEEQKEQEKRVIEVELPETPSAKKAEEILASAGSSSTHKAAAESTSSQVEDPEAEAEAKERKYRDAQSTNLESYISTAGSAIVQSTAKSEESKETLSAAVKKKEEMLSKLLEDHREIKLDLLYTPLEKLMEILKEVLTKNSEGEMKNFLVNNEYIQLVNTIRDVVRNKRKAKNKYFSRIYLAEITKKLLLEKAYNELKAKKSTQGLRQSILDRIENFYQNYLNGTFPDKPSRTPVKQEAVKAGEAASASETPKKAKRARIKVIGEATPKK